MITFSYSFSDQLLRLGRILIEWFIRLSIQTFQQLILFYKRGNFVYHRCGCSPIYRPLSYPFRSLSFMSDFQYFFYMCIYHYKLYFKKSYLHIIEKYILKQSKNTIYLKGKVKDFIKHNPFRSLKLISNSFEFYSNFRV